jgi:vacuolar iron transporter family protein
MSQSHLHGEEHRDVAGGTQRAAIFGMTDGLVTNSSLIFGFAGAHPAPSVVRLAGIAGLVAGAFSMAAGEYLSMRAQRELFERELAVERQALMDDPELERRELISIYKAKGIGAELAAELADTMMSTPEIALETHAREELGVDPSAIGRPVGAALSSLVMFALGAFLPLLPWLFGGGGGAVVGTIVLAAAAALVLGGMLGRLTGRSMLLGAVRALVVAAFAAGVTFGVGRLVGISTT